MNKVFSDLICMGVDVTVPEGCGAGSRVEFTDSKGVTAIAIVPEGVSSGETFYVAPSWLEEILDALTAEKFVSVMEAFLQRESSKFLVSGHTLEQSGVHDAYMRLYESRIEAHCKRHGISNDEFLTELLAFEERGSMRNSGERLSNSLVLVQDFQAFAVMMLQKAMESRPG